MARFVKCAVLSLFLGSSSAYSQVMLGAYIPGDGFSPEEISNFNAVMPKSLAFVNLFSSFSHDWDNLYWQASNIVAEGAMPHISWMPVDLDRPDTNLLPEITSGLHDEYITQWSDKLLSWINQYPEDERPKLMLRFGHEFNADWYPYGNSPFHFQSAWQYIHEKFEATGVNDHVEWVWSANNISVDDYNDITVYYPGSKYVDWTSIDGYNFGSNYSWSSWESFNDLYADTYLTLVNNYPDKPIVIAEIGSAEETDIPNPQLGQHGDNADGHQSKEAWIADFLQQLNTSFPAVRAVAWFNTNKELGWSITQEANTGISAYINATGSDHFTSNFLSANGPASNAVQQPSPEEVALQRAQDDYDEAQKHYQLAKSQLSSDDNIHAQAQQQLADHTDLIASVSSSVNAAWREYHQSRTSFYSARDDHLSARDKLIHERSMVVDNWEHYLNGHNEYLDAKVSRSESYTNLIPVRTKYFQLKQELDVANTTLQETNSLTKDSSGLEQTEIDQLVSDATESQQLAQINFNSVRADLLARYSEYAEASASVKDKQEARKYLLDQYRASVDARAIASSNFSAATELLNNVTTQLNAHQSIFNQTREEFLEIKAAHEPFVSTLESAKSAYDSSLAKYHQADERRNAAYNTLTDAKHHASMSTQGQSTGVLMSDMSDSIQQHIENLFNSIGRIEFINKFDQQELALSRIPKSISPEKLAKRTAQYKNMSLVEKSVLKHHKLSAVDY